jgi:soluble lytic murein transglycosylase-like protein
MRQHISKNTGSLLAVLVFLVPVFGFSQVRAVSTMYASRSYGLDDYLRKMAHEVPSNATKRRVSQFNHLIEYFTSLEYTRSGIRVSPNFIRALMSAESGGNPDAISHMNAVGLTQIMYETGRTAARELASFNYDFQHVDENRLKDLKYQDLFDPAINILICTYLIDKYNRDFGDNLASTVSAWNAGPGSVTMYNGYAPYDETMTLIARVNYYYIHYQGVYVW